MQVTHQDDYATYAVLGGQQGQGVGISDDPAFFQILSSSLYQNQKLAVVRETLCNAWDAHIEAGKTDVPVKVTLTDDEMIFEDQGKGIPHELMHEIYGVFGFSTKKKIKVVTGGFGLGCKSPWSYTDQFTVTSSCEGTKTVYNLPKSSPQAGGRPDIIPIVSTPTKETGLKVTIPIRQEDRDTFERYIRQIVRSGEIAAILNGDKLSTIPFSKASMGFLISQTAPGLESKIYVRYGNVIYPAGEHSKLDRLLNELNVGRNSRQHIILQAKPNTLSITPSREALTWVDKTKETVKQLADAAAVKIEEAIAKYTRVAHKKSMRAALKDPNRAFNFEQSVASYSDMSGKELLVTPQDIGESHFSWQVDSSKTWKADYTDRLTILEKSGKWDTDTIRGLYFATRKAERSARADNANLGIRIAAYHKYWFHCQLLNPLKSKLKAVKLPTTKLQIYTTAYWGRHEFRAPHDYANSIKPNSSLRLCRRFVVLAFNQGDVINRLGKFPQIKETTGKDDVFVLTLSRRSTRLKDARKAIQEAGMTLLDLTVAQPWEDEDVIEPLVQREKKDRKAGLIALSSITSESGILQVPDSPTTCEKEYNRLTEPEFFIQVPRGRSTSLLSDALDRSVTPEIVKKFGDKTGIVIHGTQAAAYARKGVKDLNEYLQEKAKHEYLNNPKIRKYLTRNKENFGSDIQIFLDRAEHVPSIRRLFKLGPKLPEREAFYLNVYRSCYNFFSYSTRNELIEFTNSIEQDPNFLKFIDQIKSNTLFECVEWYELRNKVLSSNPETQSKAIALLKILLKG